MISGRAKIEIPALERNSLASRSSITTAHSASNVPIIRNRQAPSSSAATIARWRSRSNANRGPESAEPVCSVNSTRRITGRHRIASAAIVRNGADSPNVGTMIADSAGPAANPATSDDSSRPRLLPRLSGSAFTTIRRIAGKAMPIPIPDTNLPPRSGNSDSPNAITTMPTTFMNTPPITRFRACPRSAIGARKIWATNEVRNPTPTIRPSHSAWMPYSSRKSSSTVNITPYPDDITAVVRPNSSTCDRFTQRDYPGESGSDPAGSPVSGRPVAGQSLVSEPSCRRRPAGRDR